MLRLKNKLGKWLRSTRHCFLISKLVFINWSCVDQGELDS